jgi:hypothetical protein
MISYDGGKSFRTIDAGAGLPNTGTARLSLPYFGSNLVRLKIESENGQFFSISSPFEILQSDASIVFHPTDNDNINLEKLENNGIQMGYDFIAEVDNDNIKIVSLLGNQRFSVSAQGLLNLLTSDGSKGKTKSVLAVGSKDSLSRVLDELHGRKVDITDSATLTLSKAGQFYQSFVKSEVGLKPLAISRTGEWKQDTQIFEDIQRLEEQKRVLRRKYSGAHD